VLAPRPLAGRLSADVQLIEPVAGRLLIKAEVVRPDQEVLASFWSDPPTKRKVPHATSAGLPKLRHGSLFVKSSGEWSCECLLTTKKRASSDSPRGFCRILFHLSGLRLGWLPVAECLLTAASPVR